MIRARPPHAIFLLALALCAAAASGCATPRGTWGPEATVLDLRRPRDGEWFGVYLGDRKVGASQMTVQVEVREGIPVLVTRSRTTIAASVGDGVARVSSSEEKTYEARPGGRLLSFSYDERSDAGSAKTITGRCADERCVATIVSGAGRAQRTLRVDETVEMADPERLCAARGRDLEGQRLALDSLQVFRASFRWIGPVTIRDGLDHVEARAVEDRSGRAAARYAFAPDGRLLEARFGAVTFRAGPQGDALAPPDRPAHLGELSRVLLPSALPRSVPGRVTLRVRGIPARFQITDARQTWTAQPDGSARVTISARAPAAAGPGLDTPRVGRHEPGDAPFLAATLAIDAEASAIRTAAREIVGEGVASYAASVAILRRLSETIATATAASTTRASETLERRRGTSEERARLFAALARAAGVPARIVVGLVHQRFRDGVPALYWRAWVEVRAAGEWIALDPELGQEVADATHLKLSVGEWSVDTVALYGNVEVLAAEAD